MILLILFRHAVQVDILQRIQVVVHTDDRVENADDDQPDITGLDASREHEDLGHKSGERRHSRQGQEGCQHHQRQGRVAAAHAGVVLEILQAGHPGKGHDDAKGQQIGGNIGGEVKHHGCRSQLRQGYNTDQRITRMGNRRVGNQPLDVSLWKGQQVSHRHGDRGQDGERHCPGNRKIGERYKEQAHQNGKPGRLGSRG